MIAAADPYDDVENPNSHSSSFTDGTQDLDKTAKEYAEFIKLGSTVREVLIRHTREEAYVGFLSSLLAILREQRDDA